ncbi:YoaK family protein [Streptomyces poriticola]|uniref:YoaK family protein n=1 Tax=Streptomyces poriticola TaxID=3120506 RepID=UPI002FCDE9C3
MSEVSPPEVRRTAVMAGLTVLAGAVDAVSFLTLGKVFCALATGNVLFLAFALAGEGDVPVARPAIAIGAFLVGIAVGTGALERLQARRRPWFPLVLVCEAVLLALAGALALWRHGTGSLSDEPDGAIVGMVAMAMGLRAANALRAHVPGMPTLLSQMAFAALIDDVVKRPRVTLRGLTGRERLARGRWSATVGGIFVGGVLGAVLLVPLGSGRALLVIAALVLILAAASRLLPQGERPD